LGQHGFLDESGIITTFDVRTAPTPSGFTKAYGINNLGQIVGTFFIEGDGAHGFVYSGGTFTQIDFPGDYGATQVFGINDLGWIVGIGSRGAFVDIAGSFVPLNIPNGGRSYGNPLPRGINRLGQVVGSFKDNVEGLQHGFVTTPIFAGTPSQASCHGQSVAALVRELGGLNGAAVGLGFSSVAALQNAILAFCGG
jgi:probable HAF family extracellular repeat protein